MSELAVLKLNYQETMQVANALVQSKYFTKDVKSAEQAYVKILAGTVLGLDPVQSMTNINIIHGNPTVAAGFIAAKIKASEKYNYRVVKSDDKVCTLKFFERGEDVGEVSYTMDEAKTSGDYSQNKNYQKRPSDMLFARAISRGHRRFAPDIFLTKVYSIEEMPSEDVVDAEFSPAQPKRAPQVTQEASTPQVDPRAGLITAEQSQDLAALLKPLQFADKNEARLFMAELTECEPVSMLEMAEECAAMAIHKLSQGDAAEMLQKWRDDRAFEAKEAEQSASTTISTEEAAKLALDLGEVIPEGANEFVDEWLAANCAEGVDIYGLNHAQAMSLLQAAREYSALEGAKAA